jgi:hypothetical protein
VLKFFRKYNKIILVVGVVILMVAFGIGPAIQSLMPSGRDRTLGTVDGTELTVRDRLTASNELRILQRRLFPQYQQALGMVARMSAGLPGPPPLPVVYRFSTQGDGNGAMAWLLATEHARKMGLSASPQEVSEALATLGIGNAQLEQLADQVGTKQAFIRQAVRHWLMVEQYASLVEGNAFENMSVSSASPGLRKLQLLNDLSQAFQAEDQNRMALFQRMNETIGLMLGGQRLSEPLMKHYVQQQGARVAGKLVPLDASDKTAGVEAPSEQRLQELFAQYKDDLPGSGEPWGIGYRYPDRVKLETLIVPLDEVRDTIEIDTAEALTYYRNNKDDYRPEPAEDNASTQPGTQPATQPSEPKPEPKPFSQVMPEVIDTLANQRAEEKAQRMLNAAANLMEQPLRTLPESAGYKQIPSDIDLPTLESVAETIEEQFGVAPQIRRFTDQWVNVSELSNLPDLGPARLADRPASLTEYVQSARTFDPEPTNPLVPLRLQVGAPSAMLETSVARAVFRLTGAQDDHPPESLEAVRADVVDDAKRIAAFKQLMKQQDALLSDAASDGLSGVASKHNSQVQSFGPTTRRQGMGARQRVPELPAIGRSSTFIDAAFDFAQQLQQDASPLADRPAGERQNGVGLKDQTTLVLYQVDQYEPITRQDYQNRLQNPMLRTMVSQWTLAAQRGDDPLAFEAIKARTGYQAEGATSDDAEAPAQAQSDASDGAGDASPQSS